MDQQLPDKLKRGTTYTRTHMEETKGGYRCWGKILALRISLTIDRKRTWVTIGEVCKRCGKIAIFPAFKKGVPKIEDLRAILEQK